MTRLNIGSHSKKIEGYLNVDILPLEGVDFVQDVTKPWQWENDSVDAILMEEFLEHVSFHDTEKVLREAFRVLKPGCILSIQVPDCGSMMKCYVNGEIGEEVPHKPKNKEEVLEIVKRTGKKVHPRRWLYAFCGAQKYGNPDIHKMIFTKESLEDILVNCGFFVDFKDDPLEWKIICHAKKV